MLAIRPYQDCDLDAIVRLWHDCGLIHPANDPLKDIERKKRVNPEWLIVGELKGRIVASSMIGYNGHRAEVNYLGVHPDHQGKGFGKLLMDHAEELLRTVGCPKINVMIRTTNAQVLAFYERLGYLDNGCHSLGKRLEMDS